MPYRLLPTDDTPGAALRRIATEQVDAALADGASPDRPLAERIHDVRKRSKKLRALLRLVRPGMASYAAENIALRDLARPLSALRDAGARIESFDRLLAPGTERRRAQPLRDSLVHAERQVAEAPATAEALETALAGLRALRGRIDGWEVDGDDAALDGATMTYRRLRGGWKSRQKTETPDPADLHDWRKRAKYHRLHLRLLGELWPDGIKSREAAADRLAESLGHHHDLEVLRPAAQAALSAKALAPVERRIAAAQAEHLADADLEAARLLVLKPKEARKLWHSWWQASPLA